MLQLECKNVIFLWISTLAPTDCVRRPRIPPHASPNYKIQNFSYEIQPALALIMGHRCDAPWPPETRAAGEVTHARVKGGRRGLTVLPRPLHLHPRVSLLKCLSVSHTSQG